MSTEYIALFADINGRSAPMRVHAADDNSAAIVVNALAAKSDASWTGLQRREALAVDDATYTNYRDAAKPVAGSTVQDQGWLFYGVQSRRNQLRVTVPAVLPALLSTVNKKIGADPIAGVGKLIDEEAVATTSFVRGRYKWVKRKSW